VEDSAANRPFRISDLPPEHDVMLRGELVMKGRSVLVADDLTSVLSEVVKLLDKSFEIVGMVSDGQAALDSIMALEPDLAILDISMPGLSGIEVARELKRRGSDTKVIFLTVHEDSDIMATCFAAGGMGYVLKMLMDSDLVLAINEALAGREFTSHFTPH
jgi:DNA-binding NarL/FixJ family response regulator